jgi:hypothetical protein
MASLKIAAQHREEASAVTLLYLRNGPKARDHVVLEGQLASSVVVGSGQ